MFVFKDILGKIWKKFFFTFLTVFGTNVRFPYFLAKNCYSGVFGVADHESTARLKKSLYPRCQIQDGGSKTEATNVKKCYKRDFHVKIITQGFLWLLIANQLSDLGSSFTLDGEFKMADPKWRLQTLKSAKNETFTLSFVSDSEEESEYVNCCYIT